MWRHYFVATLKEINMSLPSSVSQNPIVIIGSGLAAYSLAREFRKLNSAQAITLITSDSGDFYSKPMLSTAFANKKSAADLVTGSKEAMEKQLGIQILSFTQVQSIDTTQQRVQTNHQDIHYRDLVLTVGADPIHLNISGNSSSEILSVNDLNDYSIFQEKIKSKRKVLILGAGLIGSEFANDLIIGGYEVCVVDLAPQPLGRLLPPDVAAIFKDKLSKIGIQWVLGTSIKDLSRSTNGELVATLENGKVIQTDIVLSAVGLKPRTNLALKANISVNRGIVVDRFLRTNIDHIYALGDCAEVDGLNLPYVMPIMHGARALAQTLHGTQTQVSYPAMPVAVKTPAISTVVAPPHLGSVGKWSVVSFDDGVDARFHDEDGRLLGFALLGKQTSLKGQLTKELPAYHS
jgi:rubredoxin-NAD+ reductase